MQITFITSRCLDAVYDHIKCTDFSVRITLASFKMTNLPSIQDTNSLLSALNVQSTEQIISIKENGLSDANFVLTNLMKKIFTENACLCLVIVHNTIGHYQNVLKRLGHDVLSRTQAGSVKVIEPLKTIFGDIGNHTANHYLSADKESTVKKLFLEINEKIGSLLKNTNERVYLLIDDISHLLDLGIGNKHMLSFLNYCVNLAKNPQVSIIINCHISNSNDEFISNCLQYVADVNIEVSPLKTGFSHEVTGVLTVKRRNSMEATLKCNTFHYKALDRVIKVFAPGESIYHLYK